MKAFGSLSRSAVSTEVANVAPWKCKAWGCTLPGGLGHFGDGHCEFHHGKQANVFDAISELVNREAWRMRLVRCAQSGNDSWREDCRTLANKYGRPELDPIMLGMGLVDSTKYEWLVHNDMTDVLRDPVAKAVRNAPVTIDSDGTVQMTPLQMITKWRSMKTVRSSA